MEKPITPRQKQLLEVIYNYIRDTGYPPTLQEMRENIGVSSNQSVLELLNKLSERQLIRRREGAARNLIILPLGYEILQKSPLISFVGTASAGAPIEALEISGEWQRVSSEIAQLAESVFLLKVSGDSMINADIDDGDTVLVQTKKEFSSGEIVLAHKAGDATIKRFMSEDKPPYVYLKPENPNYENILFEDDVELKGKVISVFKEGHWKPVK